MTVWQRKSVDVGRGGGGATNAKSVATDKRLGWMWQSTTMANQRRRKAMKTFQRTRVMVGG